MRVLLLACAALALPPQEVGDGRGDRLVKVELLADRDTVRAGETFSLAVSFQVEPGWHIYWQNPGDSGFPTTADIRGPDGFEIGPVRFPAPERVELEGDIVEYVHTGEVVLLADARAPAALAAGRKARFEVECRWLVCTEVCYAGSGKAQIELPVAEPGTAPRPAHEKLLAAARARIPRPWKDLPGAKLDWSSAAECTILAVTVRGATSLDFFPLASDTLSLRSRTHDRDEQKSRLTLLFGSDRKSPRDEARVRGVLRVKTSKDESCYDLDASFDRRTEPAPSKR